MNTKKQKSSSIAITFYVIAVLMLIVMAFEIYMTQKSLSAQMEQMGITFADEWQTIIFGYYFSAQNLLPLATALVCYGIGHIINKLQFTQDALMACLGEAETETKEVKETEEKEELNLEELAAERKKTQAAKEAKQEEETKEASKQNSDETKEEVKEEAKEEPKKKKSTSKKKTAKKDEGKAETKEEKAEEPKHEEVKTEEPKADETASDEVKTDESVETKEEVKEAVKEETKA